MNDIKQKLNELRQRALERQKKYPYKEPSEKYLEILRENADLLYEEQMRAMEMNEK